MSIYGIDPSLTTTGVALLEKDALNGTWRARVQLIGSVGRRGYTIEARDKRMTTITEAVIRAGYPLLLGRDHLNPELVVIEGPSLGSRGGSSWDRAGLWWRIVTRMPLDKLGVVPPQTRAKWTTGKGNADKAAVAAVAARLCPDVELSTSDAADALVLALMGAHALGHRPDLDTAYRRDALLKCEWPEAITARLLEPYEQVVQEVIA